MSTTTKYRLVMTAIILTYLATVGYFGFMLAS